MTEESKGAFKKSFLSQLPAWASVGVLMFMLITSAFSFDNKIVNDEAQIKFLESQISNEDVKMAVISDRLKRIEDKLDKYFNDHQSH